ncbi:MAG: response regulator [Nitrospinota bacterium]
MPNILICEDEKLTLQVLEDFVQSQNFTAFTATDGTEALKILADNKIDLIISDIHMNPMDGVTLLETLRKDNNAVPFMLITAHPDIETYIRTLHDLGAFEYIQKPLDLGILLSVINRLLEK